MALRRDPAWRYQSAAEVRRDLLNVREQAIASKSREPPTPSVHDDTEAHRASPFVVAWKLARGVRSRIVAASVVLVVFLALAVSPPPRTSPPVVRDLDVRIGRVGVAAILQRGQANGVDAAGQAPPIRAMLARVDDDQRRCGPS
jgi:hypothetical protein